MAASRRNDIQTYKGKGPGKGAQRISANPVQDPEDHAPTFAYSEIGLREAAENAAPPVATLEDDETPVDAEARAVADGDASFTGVHPCALRPRPSPIFQSN